MNITYRPNLERVIEICLVLAILFLTLYNLSNYPITWFDEGSHLHVPKTLIRFGAYADYSSEGFRYYGPTVGVGPTVFLPIFLIFKIFGIGLLQARIVMALFLFCTLFVFYRVGIELVGKIGALVAIVLLMGSQAINIFEYGRQVLGEVPGILFLLLGVLVWLRSWNQNKFSQFVIAGILFGLAMVTKYQYVIIVIPLLGLSWIANLIYYRLLPQKNFIIPGVLAAIVLALWMGYQIVYLGPSTIADNLASFKKFTSGAALVFSPSLMKRAINELVNLKTFAGGFIPIAIFSFFVAIPRTKIGQKWSVLFWVIAINLGWYVVASISWLRYAFPGLTFLCLVAAQFFIDGVDGIQLDLKTLWNDLFRNPAKLRAQAFRYSLLAWLIFMIVVPLAQTTVKIVSPKYNAPKEMANFMDAYVPLMSMVETWEPEMGFLTDHNYHYPPQLLLNTAVGSVWTQGAPPSEQYQFVQENLPEYVLIGEFARWVELYPLDFIEQHYDSITTIGAYELFQLKP